MEGLYAESDQEDYDRIMETLKALGVKGTPGNRLMLIASEILGSALPLMKRQDVKMVLLLNDGIITGTLRDAENTRKAFYRASYNVLGSPPRAWGQWSAQGQRYEKVLTLR